MIKKTIAGVFLSLCALTASAQKKGTAPANTKPFVLGVIDGMHSAQLNEDRILNIYLPDGYDKSDTTKYPVIYLLDGSADEDFIRVAGMVQFNSFEWVNRVPKSIVVGIANTDRKRDMLFPPASEAVRKQYPTAGGSEHFIAFIEKELQPYIQNKYRVSSTKTLIGESAGGLLATEILFKKPELFNKYIIISPSIWWDNGSLLNVPARIVQEDYNRKTEIYIAVGKEGLTPSDPPRVQEVDANILADKLKNAGNKSLTVYFDYLPQEDHATVAAQALLDAFKMMAK